MKLYYVNESWTHQEEGLVVWGKNHSPLSPSPSTSLLFVNFKKQKGSFIPVVGILTSDSTSKKFGGNEAAFKRIQLSLQKKGAISYVFSPNGLHPDHVTGYFYHFQTEKWCEALFPLPNVVYNRIPFRKHEASIKMEQVKTYLREKDIPYFNECFFDKDSVYNVLKQDERLIPFLPATRPLLKLDSFTHMLTAFNKVYVKPNKGKKGNGIYVIEGGKKYWQVHSTKGSIREVDFSHLLQRWVEPLLTKDYIIQEAIQPMKWNGSRFDYRVLVHRMRDNLFSLSGIGVRQSGEQEVTTHVPKGGKIIDVETLPFKEDGPIIEEISHLTGRVLLKHYEHIGEFSMDIGKGKNGQLYIFEVNSKPMVFDELSIRSLGLENLTDLFLYEAKKSARSL
ncbi:YheC/YheD family protein [Bacillus salitolerans]|uniref:YheC/YheD family protein n=1 Tax=Bacillus salitolerans TaxID=1437434 RepID=A0ABW4LX03_9BACI